MNLVMAEPGTGRRFAAVPITETPKAVRFEIATPAMRARIRNSAAIVKSVKRASVVSRISQLGTKLPLSSSAERKPKRATPMSRQNPVTNPTIRSVSEESDRATATVGV
jgi:hypothetical protein